MGKRRPCSGTDTTSCQRAYLATGGASTRGYLGRTSSAKREISAETEILVKWVGETRDDATWKDKCRFSVLTLNFTLRTR